MKKKAKLLAGLLTLSMAASLAGCGSSGKEAQTTPAAGAAEETKKAEEKTEELKAEASEDAGQAVKITFWNMFGGGEGDFVDEIVNNFNESQNQVEVESIRLESNEFYAKYAAALSAGKGPDVAVTHCDRLAPFVNSGQLTGLNDLAAQEGFAFSSISDLSMEAVTFDGEVYSVPLDTHFHMCYYNKEILKEAGKLKEDGKPDFGEISPEGLLTFLSEIKEAVPDKKPFCINTPYFKEPFYNMYYEAGGELLNQDLSAAAVNNEKAVEVLEFFMKAYDSGLADINDVNPWDTFAGGDSALWFGGVWEAGNYFTEENGDRFGAVALPAFFGSETHWASSHGLTIPAYVEDEKKAAAMKFMAYFSAEGSKIWGKAGHVPASKAVMESEEYLSLPYRDEFVKAQKTVKFAPQINNYNAVDTIIAEQLQSIIFGYTSIEDGLASIEAEINDLIQ